MGSNDNKKNCEAVMFLACFLSLFVILQVIYYFSSETLDPFISQSLHVRPICALIKLITPSVSIFSNGISIVYGTFNLSVDSACNGIESIILIASAIFAFRTDFIKKIAGVISGCLFLYMFNIIRIMVLFYAKAFAPDLFDFLHIYAGQTLAIIAGTAFFFLWASWAASESISSRVNNEV